jgi:hypothetical protein
MRIANFTAFVLALVIYNVGVSQTGPGGVGTNDGSSNLEFWYMAQGESYANGALVNSVTDHSGNSRTLGAAGAERPTYTSATIGANNLPSFLFALNNELESAYVGNSNENMSFGMAMSYNNDGNLNVALQHGGRNTIGVSSSHIFTDFVGGSNHTSSTTATPTWTYHSKTLANSGANRLKYYMDNTNTDNFTHNIENRTSNTWIGGHGTGGGTGWNGSIAEVYKFSRILNTAEQIIIANYLSAKYSISITSADIYNEDDAGSGNYDYDVAGIGQAIDGSNHTDSRGTGIIRFLNPSNLQNDEFFFWGHDNGVLAAGESTDVPGSVQSRLTRVWRISERNTANTANVNVGRLDMRWDLTGLGAVSASDLRLLIDTDNDGTFADETPIAGATAFGGNVYEFAGVPGGAAGLRNNRRITLGTINSFQTPLPIDLISFTASPIDNKHVKINWQTVSEIQNDFFTVEKSKDGINWEIVEILNGAENSSIIRDYSVIDKNPHLGISYYHLKQTDIDGKHEYTQIISVNIVEKHNIKIFPNPTKNQITIIGNLTLIPDINIYNSLGQNVTALTEQVGNTGQQLVINLSKLNSGIYYIKTETKTTKVYKN